jgi:hypothetical protein
MTTVAAYTQAATRSAEISRKLNAQSKYCGLDFCSASSQALSRKAVEEAGAPVVSKSAPSEVKVAHKATFKPANADPKGGIKASSSPVKEFSTPFAAHQRSRDLEKAIIQRIASKA